MRILELILILLFSVSVHAQNTFNSNLLFYEDSLKGLFESLYQAENQSRRIEVNDSIINTLRNAIAEEQSFSFPFDSVPKLSKLKSPDEKFRIYNWNIYFDNRTYIYFAFLQCFNQQTNEFDIIFLKDVSKEINQPENFSGNENNWFGALYYQIIQQRHKKSTHYLLLGWHGYDEFITKKVVEVLEFRNDNSVIFGSNIFKFESEKKKRIVFQYSSKTSMMLRFDEKYNLLVFDHLSPSKSNFKNQFQYYGPDMTQDAFEFKKGYWTYISDVDVRNPKIKNSNKKQ
jgi:hypothetical protein